MSAKRRRLLASLTALSLTLGTLWVSLSWSDRAPVAGIEAALLDLRFELRGPIAPGDEVAVVLIDERTLAAFQEWPFPRQDLARLLSAIVEAGARSVAVDLLFAEARLEDDRVLAAALHRAGNVILPYVFVFEADKATAFEAPETMRRSAYSLVQSGRGSTAASYLKPRGMIAPPPVLAERAHSLAHATVVLDQGGALRHHDPVIGFGGHHYPSLPLEAIRVYRGLDRNAVAVVYPEGVRLGERFLPAAREMRFAVNYYGPSGSFETYSAVDVLRGAIDPQAFAGRLVFLGASTTGASDTFVSPFSETLPGAEYFATVADNILHDRLLGRGALSVGLEAAAIFAGGLGAALIAAWAPVLPAVTGIAGLFLLWTLGNFVAFAQYNLWIGYTLPSFAMAANALVLGAGRAFREQRLRRKAERQRRNLSRYFSPLVLDRLIDADRPFALDRTQDAAVMFVDIVGFTAISEKMPPAEAISLLRDFHARVERHVFAHAGSLDKFLGDGALACFGIPEPGAEDALNALRCARELLADIADWARISERHGSTVIRIAIGIHFGRVLMGDVGGGRRFEFTVTGDTVNVASRLEALNRQFGSLIVVSEDALEAARAAPADAAMQAFLAKFEERPAQALRGRTQNIRLRVLAAGGAPASD
ncbi:MAG: adenylate/guanylate cyclase domain-containing protein [Rhodovibrionaceae bacterium]